MGEQEVWGPKSPSGVQGQSPGGVWGEAPRSYRHVQFNIMPIKTGFCASSVCILLLKHSLKFKRHTVGLLLGYFKYNVPC